MSDDDLDLDTGKASNEGEGAKNDATQTNDAPAADKEPKKDAAPSKDSGGDKAATDDWRVRLSGGDEKELKRLQRFASEVDVYKAYREMERKQTSGEYKKAYPKDGTPEDIAQWRKDNGIPNDPKEYDLTFDDGLVIGEHDKPYIDLFTKKMHEANATPEQLKKAVSTYYEIQKEQLEAQATLDSERKDAAVAELKSEWGGDYNKNVKAMENMLAGLPDEVQEAFASARMPDGTVVGNHPDVIRWMVKQAFEVNPINAVMPSGGDNAIRSVQDEMAAIESEIKKPKSESEYWKGPKSERMQARYKELTNAMHLYNQKK